MILKKLIPAIALLILMLLLLANKLNKSDSGSEVKAPDKPVLINKSKIVRGVTSSPKNGTDSVRLTRRITVTFNKRMDPLSINSDTFILREDSDTTSISGSVSYRGYVATFIPDRPLKHNTVYAATITTMAKSDSDTKLSKDYVSYFSTELMEGTLASAIKAIPGKPVPKVDYQYIYGKNPVISSERLNLSLLDLHRKRSIRRLLPLQLAEIGL